MRLYINSINILVTFYVAEHFSNIDYFLKNIISIKSMALILIASVKNN